MDEVFKMAAPLLREATDLRENMQVRKRDRIVTLAKYLHSRDFIEGSDIIATMYDSKHFVDNNENILLQTKIFSTI